MPIAVPGEGLSIRAPGAGQIAVSPITLSDGVASPGYPVQLSADISGQNIGYIYLFVGFMDRAGGSINIADMDYIDSGATREKLAALVRVSNQA